jgi:hypothetical protein
MDLFTYAEQQKRLDEQLQKLADNYVVPVYDGKPKYGNTDAIAFIIISKENAERTKAKQELIAIDTYPLLAEKLAKRFEDMKAHDEEERRKKYLPPKKIEVTPPQIPQAFMFTEAEEEDFHDSFEARRKLTGRRN